VKSFLAVFLSLMLCLFPVLSVQGDSADTSLSLLAINVRKADALLLRSGNSAYLIDTGTEESYDKLYAVLKQEGIDRLTGVIVTHTDKDHAGGIAQLVDSDIEIENVYASAYYNKKKESKHPAVKALKGTGRSVIFLASGDELPLDGGSLKVIGPLEKDEDAENNNSLVLLAEGGGGSMLLTGDMEFPEEDSLLKAGLIPHADVLKVGNHGEDDATSNALIAAIRPSLAVISTNTDDEPDTPSRRVLKLLASWDIPVLVTQDTENGVLVTISGGKISTEMK
jgi:competence protein ComEC